MENEDADYYGFFHYRRYLAFDPTLNKDDGWGNIAYDRISDEALKEIKLQPEAMRELITKYDVITVKGRQYPRLKIEGQVMDVYHEYGVVPFQHREDLDITLRILKEKYPEYAQTADAYMKSTSAHECNMFIMKKKCTRNIVHGCLISCLRQKNRSIRPGTVWKNIASWAIWRNASAVFTMSI